MDRGDEVEALLLFERHWFDCFGSGAVQQLGQLVPEDYTFITSDGQLMNKAEGLRRLDSIQITQMTLGNMQVRTYGEVAVLVADFHLAGSIAGREASGRYCHTRVFARREGAWVPVSGQSTRIA